MSVAYLSEADLIYFNKRVLEEAGQTFNPPKNLMNHAALGYLVDMVQHDGYYPSVLEKASVYLQKINSGHIFQDGNKRTSLMALHVFLQLNGMDFKPDLQAITWSEQTGNTVLTIPAATASTSDEILETFVLEVTMGRLNRMAITAFLEQNVQSLNS